MPLAIRAKRLRLRIPSIQYIKKPSRGG